MYNSASTVPVAATHAPSSVAGSSGSTLVSAAPPAQVGQVGNGGPPVFHHEFLEATAVCFCHRFLNPFGSGLALTTSNGGNNQCLVNPCLLHYCRVCNIQLNSCRQAKIHSEGKKHEKRLSYLKFCLESTDSASNPAATTEAVLQSSNVQAAVQQTQQPQSGSSPTMATHGAQQGAAPQVATQGGIYYGQQVASVPQMNYPNYYYPAQQPSSQPPPAQPTMPPNSGGYIYTSYPDYTSPPPQVPTMMMVPPPVQAHLDYQVQTSNSSGVSTAVTVQAAPVMAPMANVASNNTVAHGQPQQQPQQHGVMSPSLTSGFSGSGDCKSTETSSILSAASYSSGALINNNYSDYCSPKGHQNRYYNYTSSHHMNNNNYTTWNYNTNSSGGHHHHSHQSRSSLKTNNQSGANSINGMSSLNSQNNKQAVVTVGHHSNNMASSMGTSNVTVMNGSGNNNSNNNSKANNNLSSDPRSVSQAIANQVVVTSTSTVYCETCHIAFPSIAVLENHLKGSRHARRVKSQQAFRQLKDAGTLFRFQGSSAPVADIGMNTHGAIRCEVCQVSVNSSHQLQAHLTGHKHRVRAIRRGVKTNQAVLSPSSSLLTSSASVSEMSYQSNSGTSRSSGKSASNNGNNVNNNKGKSDNNNKNSKNKASSSMAEDSKTSSQVAANQAQAQKQSARERRSSAKNHSLAAACVNLKKQQQQHSLALSRHRSSGCLQSRHCHSTLSLSRARSSSALNRVQSRSMNLLMVQTNNNKQVNSATGTGSSTVGTGKKNGQKKKQGQDSAGSGIKSGNGTSASDVLSLGSGSSSTTHRSDCEDEMADEEEDEGVATDATTDGTSKQTKDIKAPKTGKRPKKFNKTRTNNNNKEAADGISQEMAWMRLSNGEVARTKLKSRKSEVESADSRRNETIIPNGTVTHHDKQNNKIFKRGFNVNAQEWKPTSRRTSVGNASVKDIPMLDVFLQRLDRHSYNSDQTSPCTVATGRGGDSHHE